MAFKPDQAEKNFRARVAAERELENKIDAAYNKGIEEGRMQILKENAIRAEATPVVNFEIPNFLK